MNLKNISLLFTLVFAFSNTVFSMEPVADESGSTDTKNESETVSSETIKEKKAKKPKKEKKEKTPKSESAKEEELKKDDQENQENKIEAQNSENAQDSKDQNIDLSKSVVINNDALNVPVVLTNNNNNIPVELTKTNDNIVPEKIDIKKKTTKFLNKNFRKLLTVGIVAVIVGGIYKYANKDKKEEAPVQE